MRRTSKATLLVLFSLVIMACGQSVTPSTEPPTSTPTAAAATTESRPESPALGDIWTRPGGTVMVYVPAGEFEMGSTEAEVEESLAECNAYYECSERWFDNQLPEHTVALDGFWIDQTEVTNAQYARCVAAGGCDLPDGGSYPFIGGCDDSTYADYPVVAVDWHQAIAYCAWAGVRLPTEAEWEYAARGSEGRRYPWGDEFDGARLNFCDVNCDLSWANRQFDDGYRYAAPVGSYPKGASWCGAVDLAGNVSEWTADWLGHYTSDRQVNPAGLSSGSIRGVRGGSWATIPVYVRGADRGWDNTNLLDRSYGFRCARSSE